MSESWLIPQNSADGDNHQPSTLSLYHQLMEAGLKAAQTGDSADTDYRIARYFGFLWDRGEGWWRADLGLYRDALRDEALAPATIKAYLSSTRRGLRRIALNRDLLYAFAPPDAPIERRKAIADELETRLRIAADPEKSRVREIVVQDYDSRSEVRLSRQQAQRLLRAPGVDSLQGLRDTALIAMMLCTGVREAELVNIYVDDLHARLGGELALRVRRGKGAKQRLIPYGELDWVLDIVGVWLERAQIVSGPVFRGVYKAGKSVRDTALTTRAVRAIMGRYEIPVDGDGVVVRPHDLRRTYARRMFESGAELLAIQQNLGHRKQETTERYIGDLDADQRRAPDLYDFNLDDLDY